MARKRDAVEEDEEEQVDMEEDDDGSSSSSSDGDADDVDMALLEDDEESEEKMTKILERIEQLKQKIAASEDGDHKSVLSLLHSLKLAGELDELMEWRERAVAAQPISAKLWLDWIEDVKGCGAEPDEVEKLFRRALEDMPTEKVWLEYVQWACGQDFSKAREVYEEALDACGLRFDVGDLFWGVAIDVEEMVLEKIGQDGEGLKQRNRVDSLYRRALKISTRHVADLMPRYKAFLGEKDVPDELRKAHDAAVKTVKRLEAEEAKLEQHGYSSTAFAALIEWERTENGDQLGRVKMTFERAVETRSRDQNLWETYIAWLLEVVKAPSIVRSVSSRAVRYCPLSTSLWQHALLAHEKDNHSEKLSEMWERARQAIQGPDEGIALCRTYLFIVRRSISATGSTDFSALGELWQRCAEELAQWFGQHWDPQFDYRKMWATFVYDRLKDAAKGRSIWQDILAKGGGRLADCWLEAIRLERTHGSVDEARKLLFKAINSVADHPHSVLSYFVQFEREEGTLQQLETALEKVNAQLLRRGPQLAKKKAAETKPENDKKEERKKREKEDRNQKKTSETTTTGRKRGGPRDDATRHEDEQPPSKRQVAREEPVRDKDGFAMPTAPALRRPSPAASPSSGSNQPPPQQQQQQQQQTTSDLNGDRKWTVFISNLDFKVTAEEIKAILTEAIDIRLLHRGMSKLHKGYGYVDFPTEAAMRRALELDRTPLNGRPMLVSENRPEKDQRAPGFKYTTELDKKKLFVSNLHYDATKEMLLSTFSAFGQVADARLVTHKNGKPKGVAYVDFESDADAQRAVDEAANGSIIILERKISVAFSRPPPRDADGKPLPRKTAPTAEDGAAAAMLGIGGHSQNLDERGGRVGHASMISLVPRNVASRRAGAPLGAPKSNDQFRAMLQQKKPE